MNAKRKPDYTLRALNKASNHKGTIGAAWLNEDGSISVVLNPWVALQQDGQLVLTLFAKEELE